MALTFKRREETGIGKPDSFLTTLAPSTKMSKLLQNSRRYIFVSPGIWECSGLFQISPTHSKELVSGLFWGQVYPSVHPYPWQVIRYRQATLNKQ